METVCFFSLKDKGIKHTSKYFLAWIFYKTHTYINSATLLSDGSCINTHCLNTLDTNVILGDLPPPFEEWLEDLNIAIKQFKYIIKNFSLLCIPFLQNRNYDHAHLTEIIEIYYGSPHYLSKSRYQKKNPDWKFNPGLDKTKLQRFITKINEKGNIFKEKIRLSQFIDALNGEATTKTVVASMTLFSFLLGKLAEKQIITYKWQSLIATTGAFAHSDKDKSITSQSLKTLYNKCKDFDYGDYALILSWIDILIN